MLVTPKSSGIWFHCYQAGLERSRLS
uniref:Uncharacterized protein n=1 Tax=Anguilla anguilla TaxID=7936 RepID=A0A0E9VIY4_ANGAN